MKNEFLCRAERVTSTHPMAHHLGDINDIQDYKQKIVKQQKLRNKTLKEVKKLFTAEDTDFIESKLLLPEKENESLPEEKFNSIKVITQKPATRKNLQ